MQRMIDQIRASKLPSNMMQFAARGALAVPPDENLEILVYLATHNKIFGDLARMTLAGWDEKASLATVSNPKAAPEVLDYFVSLDNLRPKLLPALLENPSVSEKSLAKLALGLPRDCIQVMLASARIKSCKSVLDALRSNPYLEKGDAEKVSRLVAGEASPSAAGLPQPQTPAQPGQPTLPTAGNALQGDDDADTPDAEVSAYLTEHAAEITAAGETPFHAIAGAVDLLGLDLLEDDGNSSSAELEPEPTPVAAPAAPAAAARPAVTPGAAAKKPSAPAPERRENTLQKIKSTDVKGRIQLALKGNKEERSILIRDGTKVVALAVLDAPKISDGEVEKIASQKNVLEAVLRQIPLKRRFMKNYIVVRNLVANPRTPLDLSLSLMKNLLIQDLKNLSSNKEVSETIRKLALKMFKQKQEAANKK
ncbi:MAG TPA: hypothetical protein VFO39_04845 [Candidatus Sulfotelmatobacter sp.]|nr:hypothetical protein [Candidatus Sulfotelmatobacter sp.]